MVTPSVGRTQIYLTETELELLDVVVKHTGASRSELVRRAIRSTYGAPATPEERLAAMRGAAGIWRDRPFTGSGYVDATRGDLNDRLRKLGID